mmetsp:Transcript_67892/g.196512  ORF Transcript_67892/g.196512 Transcript_67892/m.196512 type:complete len:208 (-) Transcript_67892:147-770(-)
MRLPPDRKDVAARTLVAALEALVAHKPQQELEAVARPSAPVRAGAEAADGDTARCRGSSSGADQPMVPELGPAEGSGDGVDAALVMAACPRLLGMFRAAVGAGCGTARFMSDVPGGAGVAAKVRCKSWRAGTSSSASSMRSRPRSPMLNIATARGFAGDALRRDATFCAISGVSSFGIDKLVGVTNVRCTSWHAGTRSLSYASFWGL